MAIGPIVSSLALRRRENAAPQRFAEFKSALTRFGIGDRPVWITEAGLPSCPILMGADQDRGFEAQAQWLDQTLPSLVALGASRVFWFQLDENPYAPSGFGLLGPDLSTRPAYMALQGLAEASQVGA